MNKKILIADDERHITHILAFKIRQIGYEVITADDGQAAYELAREHMPDLVITDYQMPLLDGYDMCVKLSAQEATAQIPVIMLTARGHRLSPSELIKTNIQCLLAKPFSTQDLLARISELLGDDAQTDDMEDQAA